MKPWSALTRSLHNKSSQPCQAQSLPADLRRFPPTLNLGRASRPSDHCPVQTKRTRSLRTITSMSTKNRTRVVGDRARDCGLAARAFAVQAQPTIARLGLWYGRPKLGSSALTASKWRGRRFLRKCHQARSGCGRHRCGHPGFGRRDVARSRKRDRAPACQQRELKSIFHVGERAQTARGRPVIERHVLWFKQTERRGFLRHSILMVIPHLS